MTCYPDDLPGIETLLEDLGWEDTPKNRGRLDTAIKEFLGFVPQGTTCEQVSEEIAKNLDQPDFIDTLFTVLKDSLGGELSDEEM